MKVVDGSDKGFLENKHDEAWDDSRFKLEPSVRSSGMILETERLLTPAAEKTCVGGERECIMR
jgi:hypothetical protein